MTGNRKRLGEEVGDVAKAAGEHDTKVSLADPVPDPMQAHVGGLGHGRNTMATSLSQNSGVAGWGWPILAKIFRSYVTIRAAVYKPAYFVSATKEQTTGMRVEWQEMGRLTHHRRR
jgi:hypothetical protein